MTVPTVLRGFLLVLFCSMEIAGERPMMASTSGLCIRPRNWRAYAESDSTYRRCPSAYMVSNASVDFPEPERPVMTMNLSRGSSTVIFLRLCWRAPLIMSFFIRSVACTVWMWIHIGMTLGVDWGDCTRDR
ncbi:MAG: hypothetical protein A4E39_01083 [Methanoregulaceae archaeon PtaB.Bin152]|nr:MAG: hypothetical protein A4E39_01083 [Methanoregulaceae archaeon PtaB.Bin152]